MGFAAPNPKDGLHEIRPGGGQEAGGVRVPLLLLSFFLLLRCGGEGRVPGGVVSLCVYVCVCVRVCVCVCFKSLSLIQSFAFRLCFGLAFDSMHTHPPTHPPKKHTPALLLLLTAGGRKRRCLYPPPPPSPQAAGAGPAGRASFPWPLRRRRRPRQQGRA